MRLHIITIGEPKLTYAKTGWNEYLQRLKHYHQMRVTHLADKWANDAKHILDAAEPAFIAALVIDGKQFDSQELAIFLDKRAIESRELCCIIGGPDGLPAEVIARSNVQWSFSKLTFPHDLAMVILLESLYRATTINGGLPYHRG